MKQLSCKRKQKWLIRSSQQINSPVGDCSNHARTNNSFLPLIGLVQLQMALAKRCRKFDAVEVALQQSTGKNGVARFGVNEGRLKGINVSSPRSQVRGLELEQQRVEVEGGDRQYGHQYPAAAPNRFHANEQTPVHLAMHISQTVLAHGKLRNVEGSDREYLIVTSCEWFRFQNAHIPGMKRSLQRLLEHIKPDVIPLLQILSQKSRNVVSLHEYLALCMHNAKIMTAGKLKLCHIARLLAVFPTAHTSGDVLAASLHPHDSGELRCAGDPQPVSDRPLPGLRDRPCPFHDDRERIAGQILRGQARGLLPEVLSGAEPVLLYCIKTILESCDALISLNQFLIDRYIINGIDHPVFTLIENGLPGHSENSANDCINTFSPELNRFAYFGQLNIYKGCILLLEAARRLQEQGITNFSINIYGANLEHQPDEFQAEFKEAHSMVMERVHLRGSYTQQELHYLVTENDWVVVPSVCWENSPVVIQEVHYYRRPIIGSNIGGTAEKINNRGGITFVARSKESLAGVMSKAIGNTSLHQALLSQIPAPTTSKQCIKNHARLYADLLCVSARH